MLDLRQRLFIIIGLVAGFLLVFILLLVGGGKESAPQGETVTLTAPSRPDAPSRAAVREPPAVAVESGAAAPAPATTYSPDKDFVLQVARIFVERFGSYSNQNSNQHLIDAQALATDRMARWLSTQALPVATEYQGVMTRVIASSISEQSEERAVVTVDIQQTSEGVDAGPVAYKSGRVELTKIGNEWKVDGLYWE